MQAKVSPNELVNDYGKLVSAVCYRMIQDSQIAEEATQEVWYEILKNLSSFKGKSKLSTWIYTIAYRVAIDYSKNERKYDTAFLKECFDGPDLRIPETINYDKKLWIKEQCDQCLTGTLHCLNNEDRLIYLLRDLAELPYEEISGIFNKKEATIRKIVSRSRKKLSNFLNNQCTLYNPEGECNCRMKKLILDINLPAEYNKIRNMVGELNFLLLSESILPRKNYWKNFI